MYDVSSRTTALRWIEAAQEEILARTRARMIERAPPPSECYILSPAKSRLDVSITLLPADAALSARGAAARGSALR